MTTSTDIRLYFQETLTTLAPKNLTFEGQRFDGNANVSWVRTKLMPTETSNQSLGGSIKRLAGLMQIDVFGPRKDGAAAAYTIADSIIDAFPVGTHTLSTGQIIIYAAWSEALREEPTYLHVPVIVRYEVYT